MAGKIESRFSGPGFELPHAAPPVASYVPFVVVGNIVFVSGQGPQIANMVITGKLGAGADLETGQRAAR